MQECLIGENTQYHIHTLLRSNSIQRDIGTRSCAAPPRKLIVAMDKCIP